MTKNHNIVTQRQYLMIITEQQLIGMIHTLKHLPRFAFSTEQREVLDAAQDYTEILLGQIRKEMPKIMITAPPQKEIPA